MIRKYLITKIIIINILLEEFLLNNEKEYIENFSEEKRD